MKLYRMIKASDQFVNLIIMKFSVSVSVALESVAMERFMRAVDSIKSVHMLQNTIALASF